MYKLTDQNIQTYKGFQWEQGKWYKIDKAKRGGELCTNSWFHCYDHKLLAVFMNPAHAGIDDPRLFECAVQGDHLDGNGDKFGFTEMKLGDELVLPTVTTEQRVGFAILCAKQVYKDDVEWNKWADHWLDSKDRSESAARAAARTAGRAARAAGRAADAAYAAARAAARAAGRAAGRAADAAYAAAAAGSINLKAIAEQAMEY